MKVYSLYDMDLAKATGAYVGVEGKMTLSFNVLLPIDRHRESGIPKDPVIAAVLEAVSDTKHTCVYLWGAQEKPAVVYCDVNRQDVKITSNNRRNTEEKP